MYREGLVIVHPVQHLLKGSYLGFLDVWVVILSNNTEAYISKY